MRERILEVARTAGCRLNVARRNLRRPRSRTVAVVVELIDGDRPIAGPILLGGLLEVPMSADRAMRVTTLNHLLGSLGTAADGIITVGQGSEGARVADVAAHGLRMVTGGRAKAAALTWHGADGGIRRGVRVALCDAALLGATPGAAVPPGEK